MSNIFDDDELFEINQEREKIAPNNCDIFDPSVYVPENSKQRAEYIHKITAKMHMIIDTLLLNEECPPGENPDVILQEFGQDPEKTFKLIFKYLKGERGNNGSIDNFVVLTESEYARLQNKDPNKFYFTYESDDPVPPEPGGRIENNTLIVEGTISNNIITINGSFNNNVLNL